VRREAAQVKALRHNAPMAAPSPVDPSRCPLCGQSNRCAMEVARETGVAPAPCWCMDASVSFTPALLAGVPATARGLACICARCAAQQADLITASAPVKETNA